MSETWIAYAVIGVLFTFALVAWWARKDAAADQAIREDVKNLERQAEIVEKSNASAEAVIARSDPRVHAVPDIVPGSRIPEWSRRD